MADIETAPTTRRPGAPPRAKVVRRRVRATMAAHPLTDTERRQLDRARDGDVRGLRTRDDRGNWATL